MPEPIVIDVRDGLTPEALETLRRATRVQIGLKEAHVAVLGLWPPGDAAELLTVLLIRAVPLGGVDPESRAVLDMIGPAGSDTWDRLATALRAGDQLTLIDRDRGSVALRVDAGKHFSATYRMDLHVVRWRASQPD